MNGQSSESNITIKAVGPLVRQLPAAVPADSVRANVPRKSCCGKRVFILHMTSVPVGQEGGVQDKKVVVRALRRCEFIHLSPNLLHYFQT